MHVNSYTNKHKHTLGIWAGFLPGGRYTNLTAEEREIYRNTPISTDHVESFFGLVDYVRRTNSCNMCFYATSGLSCWCANNCTTFFKEVLSKKHCMAAVHVARRKRTALAKDYKEMVHTLSVHCDARSLLSI